MDKMKQFVERFDKESIANASRYVEVPEQLYTVALCLLYGQEPKQVNDIAQQISYFSSICPSCGKMLNTTCNKNFCGKCGQAVKWE